MFGAHGHGDDCKLNMDGGKKRGEGMMSMAKVYLQNKLTVSLDFSPIRVRIDYIFYFAGVFELLREGGFQVIQAHVLFPVI